MSEHHIDHCIGNELSVRVWFDYEPPQQEVIYSDNPQPGFPAAVTINSVEADASCNDILDCLNKKTLDDLEQACFESIEGEQ